MAKSGSQKSSHSSGKASRKAGGKASSRKSGDAKSGSGGKKARQASALKDVAAKMRGLDFCMMTTVTAKGFTASRPMSNNAQVAYDGHSYFFTSDDTRLVKDIKRNKHVGLTFQGAKKLFISLSGKAKLSTKVAAMREHWTPDLDKWFKDGVDTKGLVMVSVRARKIKVWDGQSEEEFSL